MVYIQDKDALVNIFLIYLELWYKIKKSYITKFGEIKLKEKSLKKAIIYTFDTYDKVIFQNKIKEHWNQYKQLFEPLALIKVKNDESKIYTIEDIFDF